MYSEETRKRRGYDKETPTVVLMRNMLDYIYSDKQDIPKVIIDAICTIGCVQINEFVAVEITMPDGVQETSLINPLGLATAFLGRWFGGAIACW